ncbi:MAG TPA: FtsX-like permease family protein [Burkholderiales bacterium]|nr:FtsX-like permease family protein [Burkholderiales bacterium]
MRLLLALTAGFSQRRGRSLLCAAGVALGVALGYGVHLVNRAAVEELAAGVRAVAGGADLEVRGGQGGFPDALYRAVAQAPGVAVASPVLEVQAGLAQGGALRLIGLDPLRAALLQPALFAYAREARGALLRPDTVLLSQAAAARLRLGTGARLELVVGLHAVPLEVIGTLPAESLPGAAAIVDIATAQWRLARPGTLNRIDLRLAPGADREAVRANVAGLLPAGVHVAGVEVIEASGAALSRAYRVNLDVLALVALVTGGFLVFSTQALEAARRRGEHGLLRVLGLERRGLARLVLGEAAAIGGAGALAGIGLGFLFAVLAVRASGGDLGAGMFRGLSPTVSFAPVAALGYWLAGVAVALGGALLPALDAARAEPARALRAGDEQRALSRTPGLGRALLVLGAGAALAFAPPLGGVPVAGYASIACLLVGGVLLMPEFSRRLWRVLPESRRPALALARAQLRGAPGQAMVSLAGIVASFALMVAMAIMVASFRGSVDRWLETLLPAELYFRTTHAGDTGYLTPELAARVHALPQVARVEFMRFARLTLDPARPPVALVARDAPPEGFATRYPLTGPPYAPLPGDPPAIWVSEPVAEVYGARTGQRFTLPIGGRPREFVVAGVWRDYARQHGAVLMAREDYVRLSGDARVNDGALWLAPGRTAGETVAAIRALPGGERIEFGTPGEIRRASLGIFDRSFAVTYALEAVAVLVGLFGLSSSLGAIVLARRREFGVLRHLGMTRREVGVMLAAEGGLLALAGAAAGLILGAAISLVLVRVINPQSFGWSMDLHPPVGPLAWLTVALLGLAMLTAWLSGREAMGMTPVRAVKEDW